MRCPNCKELIIVNPHSGKCRIATIPIDKNYVDKDNANYTTYHCDSCNSKFKTREEVIEKNIH